MQMASRQEYKEPTKALKAAASALGITVISPYDFGWKGSVYQFLAFLPDFGNTKGAVFVLWESPAEQELVNVAKDAGLFCSVVNAESYSVYDRQLFIDTLNDLGWFGDASKKPPWYTGRPWC